MTLDRITGGEVVGASASDGGRECKEGRWDPALETLGKVCVFVGCMSSNDRQVDPASLSWITAALGREKERKICLDVLISRRERTMIRNGERAVARQKTDDNEWSVGKRVLVRNETQAAREAAKGYELETPFLSIAHAHCSMLFWVATV